VRECKRLPDITTVESVLDSAEHVHACINGRWVPARPIAYQSWKQRWRAAWLVFKGDADALIWPEGQ